MPAINRVFSKVEAQGNVVIRYAIASQWSVCMEMYNSNVTLD